MSMFDYDARPVTPGVVLVGTPASRGGYAIRDFLSRNGYPFEWVDAGQPDAVRAVLGAAEAEPSALPLCILPDGSRLAAAAVGQAAAGLGMVAAPALSEYDLTVGGAGPAGLAAAVNAASEGLRTVVVEAVAPGGQAGTTSMIENLLGFPNGISGSELATRAGGQARRFGAEVLLARPLVDVSADGPGYVAGLSDGTLIRGRAVLFASGVEWGGAAWGCRGSMPCWARVSTAGPGRARRWRARVPGSSWWAAATRRARRSSGSPSTRGRSRCWSAPTTSAGRCQRTSSITCRPSPMLMSWCVRRWRAWRPMTGSGRSSCARGTAPNRCGCRRMPCSSASAAPPAPTAPRGSGWPPAPPGTW